ncbi:MAG: hypothetical protein DRP72_01490, partial [Candidatus Omnitrophota bacterium]
TVWVFFATYNERERILPREENNPYGEDTLRVKIDQLENLFKDYKDVLDWRLVVADNRSEGDVTLKAAREIFDRYDNYKKYLDEKKVILYKVPGFAPLSLIKGGTLLFAMHDIINIYRPKEIDLFAYTDCDTTVRLDLLGTLIKEVIQGERKVVAIGSRSVKGAVPAPPAPQDPETIIANILSPIRDTLRSLLTGGKIVDWGKITSFEQLIDLLKGWFKEAEEEINKIKEIEDKVKEAGLTYSQVNSRKQELLTELRGKID